MIFIAPNILSIFWEEKRFFVEYGIEIGKFNFRKLEVIIDGYLAEISGRSVNYHDCCFLLF